MKLGDVLKKERESKGLSTEETAESLKIPVADYLDLEGGESPAEIWGFRLAHIAVRLEAYTSRLLAESGRFEDTREGRAGELIAKHREQKGLSAAETIEGMNEEFDKLGIPEEHREALRLSEEEYEQIEAGKSPIEKYGPLLLGFSEVIEQPVFNLFYPCGLPFQELDDYP